LELYDGSVTIESDSTFGNPTLDIIQKDENRQFITFEASVGTYSISNHNNYNVIFDNGGGSITGPTHSGITEEEPYPGWTFGAMALIKVITGSTTICGNGAWLQGWKYQPV